ncbi:MAG: 2-oxoacid:acceptor oxidoreductase subunit alpha [Chloroflexi bacterium]|nr:2-oxoacid:acceptor oxidoreductase subunit alpha [Chloroflexota bacterium]MBU1752210.1 2-oxoacid:acceptor oxidoreductase subunit alpha [Chloroflexota bacterium]MBU1879731.1 2-oxoacid:acceptor oxidoreductase subunit alpha [Chloroflexota bacterium]
MITNDLAIRIGGEAGQGLESSGAGLAKALARAGLHIFVHQSYMSRIRGGHNWATIRVSPTPLWGPTDRVDLLLALDQETIRQDGPDVAPGGAIICDESLTVDAALVERGVHAIPLPLNAIAKEKGTPVMANTAASAAVAGLTELPFRYIEGVIHDNFKKKGAEVVAQNVAVARAAYDLAVERGPAGCAYCLTPDESAPPRMILNGNDAFCVGAVLGGCNFISAYPMTPSTSIFQWLMGHAEEYGIVAKQVEDEIAAVCMATGAAHAGARAMASTSGGGFALMVEGLGLAAMTETPLVLVDAQRPGPSTGMPTRTEQGDLLFLLRASPGDFPRIVLAPGTIEECFAAGWWAFNLAERYQTPVLVLTDAFQANAMRTLDTDALDFAGVYVDRGAFLTPADLDALDEVYLRYKLTDSGISPRALPGHPKAVFMGCSDEHREDSHFDDEDPANRVAQADKRLRKLDRIWAEADLRPPTRYGPPKVDITLVEWGSSYGPVRETVDRLNAEGVAANQVHFCDLWPFPVEAARAALQDARRVVVVEGNATGQFEFLLQAYAGIHADGHVRRYDGRPFTPEYILAHLDR